MRVSTPFRGLRGADETASGETLRHVPGAEGAKWTPDSHLVEIKVRDGLPVPFPPVRGSPPVLAHGCGHGVVSEAFDWISLRRAAVLAIPKLASFPRFLLSRKIVCWDADEGHPLYTSSRPQPY